MKKIIPIIISGGAGQRLWPASRGDRPKPFMKLRGKTLLELAFERADSLASEIMVVTSEKYYFESVRCERNLDLASNVTYLTEPEGKNTGPAIALATLMAQEIFGEDIICLVLPADHFLEKPQLFTQIVDMAAEAAEQEKLVVFGIQPQRAETGYGYIEAEGTEGRAVDICAFVEKPALEQATEYISSGRHFWNSGMFCYRPHSMEKALQQHAYPLYQVAKRVFGSREIHNNVISFERSEFANLPNISIDFAVIEKASNVAMVPADLGWSDVGTWDSVARSQEEKDEANNSFSGLKEEFFLPYRSSDVHVEGLNDKAKVIAVLGLDNVIIVDTPDALLVADRLRSQDVKTLVDELRVRSLEEVVETSSLVRRPWGEFESLTAGTAYQVKKIVVEPHEKLSLQFHHRRSEHWVVVGGRGTIEINGTSHDAEISDHFFIPQGATHRLSNTGEVDLVLIEVQIGDYLGEDDIVRLSDDYGRK